MIWFLIVLTISNGIITNTHVESVPNQTMCIYKGRIAVQNREGDQFYCDAERK